MMRFFAWLRQLLAGPVSAGRKPEHTTAAPSTPLAAGSAPPTPQASPSAPLPASAGRKSSHARAGTHTIGNLDQVETTQVVLASREQEFLQRLQGRIEAGHFDVPALPPTSLAAMELCNHASADVSEVVELVTADPLLSSELLKTANSAVYASNNPAETLQQATMRIGLRALRGLILSVSMRGVILNAKGLTEYAEEVWRQAQSVARIARAIARPLGFDPERAYVLGLLHDVGKVALLSLLRREIKSSAEVSPALVGRIFLELHEQAGLAMAQSWKLPEELCSVAGKHHDFMSNEQHGNAAAFARLAHLLDLHLSLDDEDGFRALETHAAFEKLGADQRLRYKVLELAKATYEESHSKVAAA